MFFSKRITILVEQRYCFVCVVFVLFWGYTWPSTGLTLGSAIRDHSWQGFGGYVRVQGFEPGSAVHKASVLSLHRRDSFFLLPIMAKEIF